MVRLKDIAQKIGVSVMTVSKALRDEPDVSAATRSRIKHLAQQMGYVPDSTAQGLRSRTTKLLGIAIPSITNPIYARVFFAIEEKARDLGYDLLLAHTQSLPEREEFCIRRFLSRRVDGLFIAPVYRLDPESRIYQELLARQTPTILLGPPAPFCKSFMSVEIEELVASYTVTQHLLKLGHKRIAYLTGPTVAPGRRNAWKATAAPCAKPIWTWMTGSSFRPGLRWKTAPKPRCRCSTKPATPPPSRRSTTSSPSVAPKR